VLLWKTKGEKGDLLHPIGVSANSSTVLLITSSEGTNEHRADELLVSLLATQNLRDAILLAQKSLLMHLIEQAPLACP